MMNNRSFFWQILSSFIILVSLSALLFFYTAVDSIKSFYQEQVINEVEKRVLLFKPVVKGVLFKSDANIDSLITFYGEKSSTRFTIILLDGTVISDSHKDKKLMNNHGDRPEVISAINGNTGRSIRYSETLQKELLYVSFPIYKGAKVVAVIRGAVPIISIKTTVSSYTQKILKTVLFILLITLLTSIWISRRLSIPITALKDRAISIADGNFDLQPPLNGSKEILELSSSMNTMISLIKQRIDGITRQKNIRNAILSTMVEGVVSVDMEEHIMHMNDAAAKILNVDSGENNKGKLVQEVIRNSEILGMIQTILEDKKPMKKVITNETINMEQNHLEIHGDVLRYQKDASAPINGVLIAIHDITEVVKLETIRRDFVANVSHELRTPLTAIKGFVETLKDDTSNDPEQAKRFLTIILNHVNRLNIIVDDLLTLSRLEKESTNGDSASFEEVNIIQLLKNSTEVCQSNASKKDITIKVKGEKNIYAEIIPHLLEQALINLIDNAVKYSETDKTIDVTVKIKSDNLHIDVTDEGYGIPKQHLSRIFERFYRVDKARSRKIGGTGLGLAIVKHIVGVHHGSVSVNSSIGCGSTFTIIVPVKQNEEK